MPHGPEHHLEEAEHAQHSAHNPFDRRVTLSMAIVAALLACVTMLSHRAHNITLQNQIKANDSITERANRFAWYQFKKDRQLTAEGFARHLEVTIKNTRDPQAQSDAQAAIEKWRGDAAKWQDDLTELKKQGDKLTKAIKDYNEEAHKHHHRADFFDYGELALELSLILCSITLLTKNRNYWYAGLTAAILGCGVAVSGFVIPPAHEEHSTEESEKIVWQAPPRLSGIRNVRGGDASG
ncbi:MAG TPA: DUF4337 domain-containing protein [Gemmataceae bacterium]|nr:DUF4337 domain-containing protein [Gemmataceae bacterium]